MFKLFYLKTNILSHINRIRKIICKKCNLFYLYLSIVNSTKREQIILKIIFICLDNINTNKFDENVNSVGYQKRMIILYHIACISCKAYNNIAIYNNYNNLFGIDIDILYTKSAVEYIQKYKSY